MRWGFGPQGTVMKTTERPARRLSVPLGNMGVMLTFALREPVRRRVRDIIVKACSRCRHNGARASDRPETVIMTNLEALLAELAGCLSSPLNVVDVGCRWGPAERWTRLPNVRLLGFDPDAQECANLNEASAEDPLTEFFPVALGASTGTAQLHLTAEPACSSLYPPDQQLIQERPALALISQTDSVEVALETLDRWCASEGVETVDFLKVDTQGSELDILQGAQKILETARAVEVEVEFNPIYLGQPLFADVDTFLRAHGFVLWRLANLTHYGLPESLSAFKTTEDHYFDHPQVATFDGGGGQLFWANAYYVRRSTAYGVTGTHWSDHLADTVVAGGLQFWDLAARSATLALDGAPSGVCAKLSELLSAHLDRVERPADLLEAATAEPPNVDSPDREIDKTALRHYEIGQYAAEVGSRLATVLAERSQNMPRGSLEAVQDADLKPALPHRPVLQAAVGSRRVTRRVRLVSDIEFEMVLDPELDDWKTAAYLANQGSLVDATQVELVLKAVKPQELVLDVGAFIGGIALPAAASGCNVVAIEPWTHACELLRASASANRFGNLRVLRAAATEEAGMADYFPAGLYGRIAVKGDQPLVAVPTVRIDDLVGELGSPRVRLVRLDVEGAELRVIEGMLELLTGAHPPAVLFEADDAALRKMGCTQHRLLERVEELGYTLYQVGDRTLRALSAPEWKIPAVAECLAVKGLPPAIPQWKLIGEPR